MGKQQILFIGLLYILSLYNVLASKQYENVFCLFCPPTRREIDTQKPSISISYGQYREAGSLNNKGSNKSSDLSYTYSVTNTRKFSAGLDIGANILGVEVKASLGGELSYSKTESLTGKKTIPANKVGYAYIRDKISTASFMHKIQIQEKISGVWKNKGPVKTTISQVVTTSPDLKIDIKDN